MIATEPCPCPWAHVEKGASPNLFTPSTKAAIVYPSLAGFGILIVVCSFASGPYRKSAIETFGSLLQAFVAKRPQKGLVM